MKHPKELKMKNIFALLLIFLISIAIIFTLWLRGKDEKPCQPKIRNGVILTVFFSPRSWSNLEHWTGTVLVENNGVSEKLEYTVYNPVEVGNILISKQGCGYINQPF